MCQLDHLALFLALLLVMAGIETNPGPLTRSSRRWVHVPVVGHHHQGLTTRFGPDSVGRQCVPNSVCAIAWSQLKNITHWTTDDIDHILDAGDALYNSLNVAADLLCFADIPAQLHIFKHTWQVTQTTENHGKVDERSIQHCLEQTFQSGCDAIILLGGLHGASASAVMKRQDVFYVFDPHSRSSDTGLPVPDGTSVLIQFANIQDLTSFVKTLGVELRASQISACVFVLDTKKTVAEQKAAVTQLTTKKTVKTPLTHNCQHCGKGLNNAYNLAAHETKCGRQVKMSKPKTYQCEHCGKTLYNTYNLKQHEQRCKKEKDALAKKQESKCEQYVCQHCQHKCDNIHNLQQHENTCLHTSIDTIDAIKVKKQSYMKRRRSISSVNEAEKLSERKRKVVKRSDSDFSQQENERERKRKQLKRSQADVREHENQQERKRKQLKRSQADFHEVENVKAQKRMKEKRADDQYREAQNVQQRHRRSDPDVVENESARKKLKQFGKDLAECIQLFLNITHDGPIYVCTSCHQTKFVDDVQELSSLRPGSHQAKLTQCTTGMTSVDGKEWLCHTCKNDIYKDMIPKLSTANKVGFPKRPPELELYPLEETVISIYLPFMTVRSLPVCGLIAEGQKMIVGNVIHVPNDIASTVEVLPRNLNDIGTIALQLKRKKQYKSSYLKENIRPQKVFAALRYLIEHSPMYKDYKLQMTCDEWLALEPNRTSENRFFVEGIDPEPVDHGDDTNDDTDDTDDVDTFEEIPVAETTQGNLDTLLDEHQPLNIYQDAEATMVENRTEDEDTERVYTIAPGEGKKPVFRDVQAQYKCFPTIFCGQERVQNKDRPRNVTTTELFRGELRHVDTRVCLNIPVIFWMAKYYQMMQIVGRVHLALRRLVGAKHKKVTAGDLLDAVKRDTIERLDEGYKIFRTVRNSPPYFDWKKREVLAMCRQIGYPTIFFSLSSADTQWEQLLQCLGKLVDNKTYSFEYIKTEMTIAKKCQLISAHPAACSRYFHHRVEKYIKMILMGPHSPFGEVVDFFYRVEFQKRGSPHIHGFLWVKGAPNVRTATETDMCDYVDSCMSCSSDVPDADKPFVKLQLHKHSRSCRKGSQSVCRFGAPWPPMRRTRILEPLTADTCPGPEFTALQQEHKKLMKVMTKMPGDVVTFDEWLAHLNMTEEHYLKVLQAGLTRRKMFLQRAPSDTRVNPYMKGLLRAWRGNHDVQFVLEPYQCISYICDYMTKSQKGLSELVLMASEEADAGNLDLRRSVKHIGEKFLNACESSVQQCCYDILGLPITNSTRKKEFINTNPPEKRVGLCKTEDALKELKPNSKEVTMLSNIDRYAMRPKKLEQWCLAEFVAKTDIDYGKSRNSKGDDNDTEDPEELEVHETDECYKETDDFPYTLRSGHMLRLRTRQKIIRFRKYNPRKDPENYFRERLLLYAPWRQEDKLKGPHETYETAFKAHQDEIMKNMNIYEPFASEIDAAFEEFSRLQESQQVFDPTMTEGACSDDEEPSDVHNLPVMTPDENDPNFRIDLGIDLGIRPTQNDQDDTVDMPQKMPDEDYFELLGKLNTKQQEFHSHVMQVASQNEQVMCVLHGGAGTGKSTVLTAVAEGLERFLRRQPGTDYSETRLLTVAPTGKAAYNVRGQTIHRAFCIPASQKMEFKPLGFDILNTMRSKFHGIEWVLIDEFSMVGKRMLLVLHLRLQEIRGNQLPFGGMNMMLVGDLHQLQPVKDGWIFENIDPFYGAFAPNIFKDNFKVFELDEIMRQREDKAFAELLNRLRTASHTTEDIKLLESRLISETESLALTDVPHFYTTNVKKDEFNEQIMEQTAGETVTIQAQDKPQENIPQSEKRKALAAAKVKPISAAGNLAFSLTVKTGVHYDLTANVDASDGLVNGAECTVRRIEASFADNVPACIWVQFADPHAGAKARQIRGPARQFAKKGWTPIQPIDRTFVASRNNIVVTRKQFPLIMSAARTIHKAQSATHQEIVVSMSGPPRAPTIFWEHMHYVAFSRCTTLHGLHILDINEPKIRTSSKVCKFLKNEKTPLELCYEPTYQMQDHIAVTFNNVCSINKKWSAVKNNKNITNSAIIVFAETWLSSRQPNTDFQLPGFQQVRMDSEHRVGHRGMLLYYRDSCQHVLHRMHQSQDIEMLHLQLRLGPNTWNIYAVYKPPQTSTTVLFNELDQFTESHHLDQPMLIVGDFNINVADSAGHHFVSKMYQKYKVTQLMTGPTTWEGTQIDLAFANDSACGASSLLNTWSQHNTIVVKVPSPAGHNKDLSQE